MAGVRMVSDIVIEIVTAIVRFLLNPVVYIAILFAIFLGYSRVKQERKYFNRRIVWGWTELVGQWKHGWLLAVIISLISVVAGLTVSKTFLFIWMVILLVAMGLFLIQVLSPMYTMSLAALAVWAMNFYGWTFSWKGFTLEGSDLLDGAIVTITILTGLSVLAEGVLIRRVATSVSSPRIEKTKRGMQAIMYRTRKLWILPIVFLVPGEGITAYVPYWPQFTFGETSFAFVLFPVVIGFSKKTRKNIPAVQLPNMGRAVYWVGLVVFAGGLVAYFKPVIGFIALATGVIIRLGITIYYALQDQSDVYAVAPSTKGAIIAAVLPGSPAEKMGLLAGECIAKVNGQRVFTENELYEALQINAAHCRIEVLDRNNEIRLTQHVIYSTDHYRIGLLLAEQREG